MRLDARRIRPPHLSVPRRGLLVVCALVACATLLAGSARRAAAADEPGEATVRLMVAETAKDKSHDAKLERDKLSHMIEMAAKRLRRRLATAHIKQYTVETEKPNTIRVHAYGGVTHALLAGIVVPQGRFELRPAVALGDQWTRASGKLPKGVEIRQEAGSMAVEDAYLWSHSRHSLEKAVAATGITGFDVKYYPAAGGWRTLALGKPVATQDDVARARIRRGNTGETYVRVSFHHKVTSRLPHQAQRRWAVVLDGEVVSTMRRMGEDFGAALSVTAPRYLTSESARVTWAQQVAGRLSAYMSVPLVELSGD